MRLHARLMARMFVNPHLLRACFMSDPVQTAVGDVARAANAEAEQTIDNAAAQAAAIEGNAAENAAAAAAAARESAAAVGDNLRESEWRTQIGTRLEAMHAEVSGLKTGLAEIPGRVNSSLAEALAALAPKTPAAPQQSAAEADPPEAAAKPEEQAKKPAEEKPAPVRGRKHRGFI